MPDKKQTKKETAKLNESKEEKFKRIATKRVQTLLKYFRLLGNCSNTSNYKYSEEQIINIFSTIRVALTNCEKNFKQTKEAEINFSL